MDNYLNFRKINQLSRSKLRGISPEEIKSGHLLVFQQTSNLIPLMKWYQLLPMRKQLRD